MLYRVWSLIVKELLQLMRDRVLVPALMIGMLGELLLLGYSMSQGIRRLPLAVVDLDRSAESRRLVTMLENSRTFRAQYFLTDISKVDRLLEHGKATAAVVVPRGFSTRCINSGAGWPYIQALIDGAEPAAASASLESIEGVVAAFDWREGARGVHKKDDRAPIDIRVRAWFNADLDESDYTLPSEVGFSGAAVALIVASLGIARERERGTLEQLMVTPIRPVEIVIGKAVPAVIVAFIVFMAMIGTMIVVFDVPMRGSWPLLLGLLFFYMLVELGWGLMISSISGSQRQAILMVIVMLMVELVFSGYAFPVETMPQALQVASDFVAIKHWLIIFRSILLKGVGLDAFWPICYGWRASVWSSA